jgi:hypothetical protein
MRFQPVGFIPIQGGLCLGLGRRLQIFMTPFTLDCYCSCMSFIVVDVEADGPIPAEYSMVCFGAVMFDDR